MFKGQREILKLNLILNKLSHSYMDLNFYAWMERGVPPEDIDRVLITLDVLEEELDKMKAQCDEALKLIGVLKYQF